MTHDTLRDLLEQVRRGTLAIDDAARGIRNQSGQDDLGFARLDTDRERRTGIAEVIFAPGKTDDQLARLIARSLEVNGKVLVTRVAAARAPAFLAAHDSLHYDQAGRLLMTRAAAPNALPPIAVVSAGTSDLPVAEEAAGTLEHLGHTVDRIVDVGIAGMHRLLSVRDRLLAARVLIVVAGMEGALPSVVAGLVPQPVVAVPTSVGYGASFGGIAALLGMLNSCAGGIGVVNIDNGFGAATLAHRIAPGGAA